MPDTSAIPQAVRDAFEREFEADASDPTQAHWLATFAAGWRSAPCAQARPLTREELSSALSMLAWTENQAVVGEIGTWNPEPFATDFGAKAARAIERKFCEANRIELDEAAGVAPAAAAAKRAPPVAFDDPCAASKPNPGALMARAFALCPSELPHMDKMRWIADYCERNGRHLRSRELP